MSNTEPQPAEYDDCGQHDVVELLRARDVPLGGPRAMTVRRSLPQRNRSLIGPWCFVDHFGPDDVGESSGMRVPRHPHTGLATVTLLFAGAIDHLDSTGFANSVRPGEVNLMIAGRGVSHSEFSTPDTAVLHGVQLWYALPDAIRDHTAGSQHAVAEPASVEGGTVRVYIGELTGIRSPIDPRTPALAAEVAIDARAEVTVDLDPAFEHGLLLDEGLADVDGVQLERSAVLYLPRGASTVSICAADDGARVVIIGGPPLAEDIVMWWNFVGRSHAEIEGFRADWQHEIGADVAGRFGPFPPDTPRALPAPGLPTVPLKPRRRAG